MSETPVVTRSTTWSPGLAAVLSFFIPGLGQLYKGRIGRGILIFIGQVCIYDAYKGPHASELKA